MQTRTPSQAFDAFVSGTLAKGDWTHEAHLITCWVALQSRTPGQTLTFLRKAITDHNCGLGIENSATSGYHETLTAYYVNAVAGAGAATVEDVFDHPSCSRTAPLQHWSKEVLFSARARSAWVEPDLLSLGFQPATDG